MVLFPFQGKVFPKLRKRSPHGSCESFSDKDEDEATDYVFRIIYPGSQEFGMLVLMNPLKIVTLYICVISVCDVTAVHVSHSGTRVDRSECESLAARTQKILLFLLLTERLIGWRTSQRMQPR